MAEFLTYISMHALVVLVASFYYSHALLLGIACARDEQHRTTPLSPWHLFMRKFKWRGIGIAAGLVPWVWCGSAMSWHAAEIFNYGSRVSFWRFLEVVDRIDFSICFAMIGTSFAAITHLAPRFKSSMYVAAIGTFIGLLLAIGIVFLLDPTHTYRTYPEPHAILILTGLAAFVLTWFHVRFILDGAWFRFDG